MTVEPEWTPEREAALVRMRMTSASYDDIANALNMTKSAVASKCSRMGIAIRGGDSLHKSSTFVVPVPLVGEGTLTMEMIDNIIAQPWHACNWPTGGDSRSSSFTLCGAERAPGDRSYCAHHRQLSRARPPTRAERDAWEAKNKATPKRRGAV